MKENVIILKVPVLKIRGVFHRKQGFVFDMYTWFMLSERMNIPLSDQERWSKVNNDVYIFNLMYCSAVSYNRMKGVKVNFNEKHVSYWIDQIKQKDLQAWFNCMLLSRVGGETIKTLSEKAEKKNNRTQS